MAEGDQGEKGSTLQSIFGGCFGCCTGSTSPANAPSPPGDPQPTGHWDINIIELVTRLPAVHLPADSPPRPNVPANDGALAQAQEDAAHDFVIAVELQPDGTHSNNTNFRVRPRSLPTSAPTAGRVTRTRVSCRPLSAAAFYGPPPSPPPAGPLPPLPAQARQRETTHTSQAGASRSGASQQTGSKQQKSSAQQAVDSKQQQAVDSQQQLNETLTIDSQQTGNPQQIVNSQETSNSVQANTSQQLNILQQLSKQHSPKMESAILHPLPIISIGDYVTRHLLRNQPGPIVGALFGQQNGREVTVEHAYEVQTAVNGDEVTLEPGWFETRLEQSEFDLSAFERPLTVLTRVCSATCAQGSHP